jgi:hypothetical protein
MDQQVVILYERGAYLRVLTGVSVINLRAQAEVAPLAPHKPGQPHSQ